MSNNIWQGLIRRAQGKEFDLCANNSIKKRSESCTIFHTYAPTPRRFKPTVGTIYLHLNHILQVNTMYSNNRPIIHTVDTDTHFWVAAFLRSQSTGEISKTVLSYWNRIHVGPPDYPGIDQGRCFISGEMRGNLEAAGMTLRESPIENHGAIGTVDDIMRHSGAPIGKSECKCHVSALTNNA